MSASSTACARDAGEDRHGLRCAEQRSLPALSNIGWPSIIVRAVRTARALTDSRPLRVRCTETRRCLNRRFAHPQRVGIDDDGTAQRAADERLEQGGQRAVLGLLLEPHAHDGVAEATEGRRLPGAQLLGRRRHLLTRHQEALVLALRTSIIIFESASHQAFLPRSVRSMEPHNRVGTRKTASSNGWRCVPGSPATAAGPSAGTAACTPGSPGRRGGWRCGPAPAEEFNS